jgi:general secretion pathway protein E
MTETVNITTTENNANLAYLPRKLIGTILLEEGHISEDDLKKALAFQRQYGGRLGSILIRIGAVSEDVLFKALSDQLNLPLITKEILPTDPKYYTDCADLYNISPDWFLDQEVLVWLKSEDIVFITARDPLNPFLQEALLKLIPDKVHQWWLARSQELDRALEHLRHSLDLTRGTPGDEISHLRELAEEAPVVELVNNTFAQAFNEGSSDIHIEPGERNFHIRYRIDGVLQNKLTLPRDRFDAVASRLKLISGIDIAERRLPQDGRLSTRISGQEVDVRVSSLPGVYGESIVMRLLPKERKSFKLERLGFAEDQLALYREWVSQPHGILLVTGPTGSGKSTTLYATLEEINQGDAKIITIEDPVEYNIPGITQVQVLSDIGFTFSRALRSILRQDPDTIMIGEIRDLETAEIAIQAALTGHLVFSTLHTNDSLSAFTRLTDMGVEPFLVASSVLGVQAQRLVRRLCPDCSKSYIPDSNEVQRHIDELRAHYPKLFKGAPNFREAQGCHECQGIGYRGRLGIYELANVTKEIQDLIMAKASAKEIVRMAKTQGYRTLRDDGFIKAYHGETSIDEVLRITGLTQED